ncbi:uncharacterized protein LOC108681725 [Hyalella azteca]|uniref:Uncharacterized protein LOC108681725 n=1 Tax=Hyalella azteca TaxID=294128 RepID=A0A979FR78_HYAAZ|nr:uncharacterized protein LOC108681725 [Hyalella azteca]
MSQRNEGHLSGMHSLHRSVASVVSGMFPTAAAAGDRHDSHPIYPAAEIKTENLVEIEDEDLFASQATNDEQLGSQRGMDGDAYDALSQGSGMLSFSQVAKSYKEASQSLLGAGNDRGRQDSSVGFTQILEDINKNFETQYPDSSQRSSFGGEPRSLFSSASALSKNFRPGQDQYQSSPQSTERNVPLNNPNGNFSTSICRPLPLVPITPFSTNGNLINKSQSSFAVAPKQAFSVANGANRAPGNITNTFSATDNFSESFYSSPDTVGSFTDFGGPRGDPRESRDCSVPAYARAPPFARTQMASNKDTSALQAPKGREFANNQPGNIFLSAARGLKETESYNLSQEIPTNRGGVGKENDANAAGTRFADFFQRAGKPGNPFQQVDRSQNLVQMKDSNNNLAAGTELTDRTNVVSSQSDAAMEASDDGGKAESEAQKPTSSAPIRPVFGRSQKIAPNFKPVFKKPVINNSTGNERTNSVTNGSNSSELRGNLKASQMNGQKQMAVTGNSEKYSDTKCTSQVCKSTYSVKNEHNGSVSASIPHRSGEPSFNREALPEVKDVTVQGKLPLNLSPASASYESHVTTESNPGDQNSAFSATKEIIDSGKPSNSQSSKPLKLKKTNSVPKPKIIIKTERELCNLEDDEFMAAPTSSKSAKTAGAAKPKAHPKPKNGGREKPSSPWQQASHLAYFKQKMSFLYTGKTNPPSTVSVEGKGACKRGATSQAPKILKQVDEKLLFSDENVPDSANRIQQNKGKWQSSPVEQQENSTSEGGVCGEPSSYEINSSLVSNVGAPDSAPSREGFTPQAVSSPLPQSRALTPLPSSVSPIIHTSTCDNHHAPDSAPSREGFTPQAVSSPLPQSRVLTPLPSSVSPIIHTSTCDNHHVRQALYYSHDSSATSGVHDATSGAHDATSGTHDASPGAHDATSGERDSTSGVYDATSGVHDATSGAHDAPSGAHDATSGAHDAPSDVNDASSSSSWLGHGNATTESQSSVPDKPRRSVTDCSSEADDESDGGKDEFESDVNNKQTATCPLKSSATKTKQTNFVNPAKLAKNSKSFTMPSPQEQPWISAKKKSGTAATQLKTRPKSSDATRRRRSVAGSGGHPVEDLRRIQNLKT